MKLEVNITKTKFFVILFAVVLLAGVVYVKGYGGTQPVVMGHSLGELAPNGFINTAGSQTVKIGTTGSLYGRTSPLIVEGAQIDTLQDVSSFIVRGSSGFAKALDLKAIASEGAPEFLITTGAAGTNAELSFGAGSNNAVFTVYPGNNPNIVSVRNNNFGVGTANPVSKFEVQGGPALFGSGLVIGSGSGVVFADATIQNTAVNDYNTCIVRTGTDTASCNSGERAISGGGFCTTAGQSISGSCPSNIAGSCLGNGISISTAWTTTCSAGSSITYAVCCPV